ncbi:MAG: crtO [Ilumatobacteraceae bacterium]|nr:crtO [Ilumatobacteraceae bacterium]
MATRGQDADFDAIVIGAGHNGLVCAAYLARAGLRTVVLEARAGVGGTAASEQFAGATVNICNCDHITFRTTPVIEELGLAAHGLRYLDMDPSTVNMTWDGGPAWTSHHDVEQTIDGLARTHPDEVDGYRRYLAAAMPAVRLVFDAANDPPSLGGLTRKVLGKRGKGVGTLLRWSRRSAADVLRSYFSSDALLGPAVVTGPMVWGISPELAGSGLGALTYAIRHVGTVGRPVGGSGMVPVALRAVLEHHGGEVRTSVRVAEITCEGSAVRGVRLDDGTEITAPTVVSACNPHDTFVSWLKSPPSQADALVRRWRAAPAEQGYESKLDAIIDTPPKLVALGDHPERIGSTVVVAPSLANIHHGYEMMGRGEVLRQPGMMVNVPSIADPTLAPEGKHVFSMEVLFTPYQLRGGWASSREPRRWLDQFASLTEPGFSESLGEWRAMTPDRYEREFNLPAGHATSFAGGPLAALRNKDPELVRYETPVKGLYLTGAATFPGAGVWGASGRNAALTVLRRT